MARQSYKRDAAALLAVLSGDGLCRLYCCGYFVDRQKKMSRVVRLLLLAVPALATAASVDTQSSTSTHYGCSTRVACSSHEGPVPTSTVCSVAHRKHTIVQVTTVTPVTTVTGRPTTKVVTETATTTVTLTEPTLTGTYTSTSTFDSTVTTTVATITSTETEDSGTTISSTVTSTSTIPTPPGYIGVSESTGEQNAASGTKKKGRSPIDNSRQLAAERRRSPVPAAPLAKRAAGALPKEIGDFHPQQVLCTLTVETLFTVHSTRYAPTHTVVEPGPTVTASSTTTTTSTSTVIPSATTTVTVVSTSTVTSSATETDSATVFTTATVVATSTSTLYAACATNFLLGPALADGTGIVNFQQYQTNYGVATIPSATTGYDCCVACQTDSNEVCWASWFDVGTSTCLLVTDASGDDPNGTCDAPYNYGYLLTDPGSGTYQIANGPCGSSVSPPQS